MSLGVDYTTLEEGMEKLRGAVATRNQMGGALYWQICEDECLKLADKLSSEGADKNKIAEIGGWRLKRNVI